MKKQKDPSNFISAIIDIECQSERTFGFDRIAMRIARFPEVTAVHVVSGKADLMVRIEAASLEEISKFVTEVLAPMKGIRSTSTHFILKTYKEDGVLLHEEPKPKRIPIAP